MSHAPEEMKRSGQCHLEPGLLLGNIKLQCINESCSHQLILGEPNVPRSTGRSQGGNGPIFVSHISMRSGLMVRPRRFLERHDNQSKLGNAIKGNIWVAALAVPFLKVTRPTDLDVIRCNKLVNRFHFGGMMLGFAYIVVMMGN